MLLTLSNAQELSPFALSLTSSSSSFNRNPCPQKSRYIGILPLPLTSSSQQISLLSIGKSSPWPPRSNFSAASSSFVEQLVCKSEGTSSENGGAEVFDIGTSFDSTELKHLSSPKLKIRELEELPEQWRRSKLAWLCKELPAHKSSSLIRVLNAQRKWVKQEDATYVAVHCMRIRENEAGFRVYKWMMEQHWFQFDYALATKLAEYVGKERKFLKCREIFDDIINQGKVPSESTFHILVISYLSSPDKGCLEEACNIYNRMIQLGNYKPRLSLHNSLFRALVSKPGSSSKQYLKQAEYIFHNLATSGLQIQKEIYAGLIWLHSYQDTIDSERIAALRAEMQLVGIEESKEVLMSIMRVCSKESDVDEAERTWLKLIKCDDVIPSQAFLYKMEVYSKIGDPMKSLEIFREMQEHLGAATVVAYHKIIEILSRAREIELTKSLMKEFIESGLEPLMPSFVDVINMYFLSRLHHKVESTFVLCLEKCRPNRTVYNLYLFSLLDTGNLDKAEEIFKEMHDNEAIGVNTRSCNAMLSGYLSTGEHAKAERMYNFMCQKKYDIDSSLNEKLDFVLSLTRKVVTKPSNMKLIKEQREILIGMLLGGLQIFSDENRRNHSILFEFDESIATHSILKGHIHNQFHEWLASLRKPTDGSDDIPWRFTTISHSFFGFYADHFWPNGQPVIPKLVHRWLSPRVLAYWYMYGGHKTSTGDILLKLKGSQDGVDRIVKTLKLESLNCKVRKKGRVFWIGFLGADSVRFRLLIEPYILGDLEDDLNTGVQSLDKISESLSTGSSSRNSTSNVNDGLDSDEKSSGYL